MFSSLHSEVPATKQEMIKIGKNRILFKHIYGIFQAVKSLASLNFERNEV